MNTLRIILADYYELNRRRTKHEFAGLCIAVLLIRLGGLLYEPEIDGPAVWLFAVEGIMLIGGVIGFLCASYFLGAYFVLRPFARAAGKRVGDYVTSADYSAAMKRRLKRTDPKIKWI
jgi:hypothetical protein